MIGLIVLGDPAGMDTIAAAEAKTNFGALLDKARREPVMNSRNGRAVAVVMSKEAFDSHQRAKLELLRREIDVGLADGHRGAVVSGDAAFAEFDREIGDA